MEQSCRKRREAEPWIHNCAGTFWGLKCKILFWIIALATYHPDALKKIFYPFKIIGNNQESLKKLQDKESEAHKGTPLYSQDWMYPNTWVSNSADIWDCVFIFSAIITFILNYTGRNYLLGEVLFQFSIFAWKTVPLSKSDSNSHICTNEGPPHYYCLGHLSQCWGLDYTRPLKVCCDTTMWAADL